MSTTALNVGGSRSASSSAMLIGLLGVAILLSYVDRGLLAVSGPLLKDELGLSATEFGLAVSAFFWVYAPGQLVGGWLVDRSSVHSESSHIESAEKTYTPAQLRSMVTSGSYPKQGNVTTKTERVDYVECISRIESAVAAIEPNYPAVTITNTDVMRVEKIWTNDGAMTMTCSAPEGKLVITAARIFEA